MFAQEKKKAKALMLKISALSDFAKKGMSSGSRGFDSCQPSLSSVSGVE